MRPLHLSHPRFLLAAAGACAALMAVTACGGGGADNAAATASIASIANPAVTTRTGPAGAHLADGAGRSLYIFAADTGTTSRCTGGCAQEWAPFTAAHKPAVAGSATVGRVGTSARPDGKRQVTYAGHPLYYFVGDTAPGQANGQGLNDFGGLWWLVSPNGTPVTASAGNSGYSSGY